MHEEQKRAIDLFQKLLIGLAIEDADALAESMGFLVRVSKIDGVHRPPAKAVSSLRVNLDVESDIVVAIAGIY